MNGKRFYFVMIGLTCLLGIAIVGSVYVANMVLKKQSDKLYGLKLTSQVLNQQQINLAKNQKDIEKYAELEREADIIVPQDKDQAQAVREIVHIAKKSNVTISSIIFPASTLGNTKLTNPSASSSSDSSSGTTTTKSPPITQTQPITGLKGVYIMPITVQANDTSVPFSSFDDFLARLEQNRRTSQVSSINIQPVATQPGYINFTLILNVYIKP